LSPCETHHIRQGNRDGFRKSSIHPGYGLARNGNEAVVVNLDIEPVEKPEQVAWIDPIHEGRGFL
jgi:hypothetical protein